MLLCVQTTFDLAHTRTTGSMLSSQSRWHTSVGLVATSTPRPWTSLLQQPTALRHFLLVMSLPTWVPSIHVLLIHSIIGSCSGNCWILAAQRWLIPPRLLCQVRLAVMSIWLLISVRIIVFCVVVWVFRPSVVYRWWASQPLLAHLVASLRPLCEIAWNLLVSISATGPVLASPWYVSFDDTSILFRSTYLVTQPACTFLVGRPIIQPSAISLLLVLVVQIVSTVAPDSSKLCSLGVARGVMHRRGKRGFARRVRPLSYWVAIELMPILRRRFVTRRSFVIGVCFVRSWGLRGCSIVSRWVSGATMPVWPWICIAGALAGTLSTSCWFHSLGEIVVRVVLIEAPLELLKFLSLRLNPTEKSSTWAWWPLSCFLDFFFLVCRNLLRILHHLSMSITTLAPLSKWSKATFCRLLVCSLGLHLEVWSTSLPLHV